MSDDPRAARDIPFLRTFESRPFRLLLATVLAVIGVLMNISIGRALLAGGMVPFEDFVPYFTAALRMAAGESPYLPSQLAGPFDAICFGCYLYPPQLAQILAPVTVISIDMVKVLWFVLLAAAALGSAWIGASVGGATRSLERVLWTVVATTWFMPVFHSNWLGNVGAFLALGAALVALGGVIGGIAAAAMTWLKVAPLTYVPVAFSADPRSRVAVVVTLVALFVPSVLLAPAVWPDMVQMLWNLARGEGVSYLNLAPAAMANYNDWPGSAVSFVRVLTLLGAGVAVLGAMWVARRSGGLPLATLLATVAMLLLPGTLWYHYFAVLLPLGAMAWPRSNAGQKLAIFGAAATISLAGLQAVPIATSVFAAAFMLAVAGWVLRPRPEVALLGALERGSEQGSV